MMGTGRFALPTFLSLYDSPHEVVGLFTQPDREGRGHHRHVNPLKEAALERGTPVFQPAKVNTPEALADLRALQADLCVVAAYGQILSRQVLEAPRLGAVNLHASLLPKYRGAAPIQYAICNGETETGVTIFRIEPKLDAGPVVAVGKIDIGPEETSGDLEPRLAELAVPLTAQVLDAFAHGQTGGQPQDTSGVTLAPRLSKAEGAIPWHEPAQRVADHIRARQPWPTPFTFFEQPGQEPLRVIVTRARPVRREELGESVVLTDAIPGTVVTDARDRLGVQCGGGLIELLELKPEGKREMSAADFLHGHNVQPGDRLRPEA
jgi:methionyl-tRNA formyltransferase